MDLILNSSIYVQLALGLLILWIIYILTHREQQLKLSEPPLVPYKHPIIGHTIDYYKDNENFINKCHEEYGEIFSLYVFGRVITIVGKGLSPEVFKNYRDFSFVDAQLERFPMDYFLRRSQTFLTTTSEILQKTLPGELKSYMERLQRQLPKTIDEMIGDGKVLQPPLKSIQVIVAKLTTICVMEDLSDDKELVNALAFATDDLAPYLSIPPILGFIHPTLHKYLLVILIRVKNPFLARRELIKQKIIPVIKKRLHEMKSQGDTYNPPVDTLQKYVEIFRDDYDAITDIIVSTIFASITTTSNFLTYSLQEFANNPQIHEELLKEQEQLSKDDDENPMNKIAKMEKLDSLVKEALRMNADIVGLSHQVVSTHFKFSNGYQIPKDRILYLYLQEIHSNEKSYGLNSNEFNAFRHLKNSALHTERNFLAFGLGKHACPGRSLAVNGIKLILRHLLLKYNIKNVGNVVKPKVIGPYKFPSDAGMIFEKKSNNVQ